MDEEEPAVFNAYEYSQKCLKTLQFCIGKLTNFNTSINGKKHDRFVSQLSQALDYFQEDPQLLDPHLKAFVPPLFSALLKIFTRQTLGANGDEGISEVRSLCTVVCAFCKVRGRKVISKFLDNEPRYLELLLDVHTKIFASKRQATGFMPDVPNVQSHGGDDSSSWQIRYVIILWLSHLVLTPFDLSILSQTAPSAGNSTPLRIAQNAPFTAQRLTAIAQVSLASPMGERVVAAELLSRLCLRTDMTEIGLLNACVEWSLSYISSRAESPEDLYTAIGLLTFLNAVTSSGSLQALSSSVMPIYDSLASLCSDTHAARGLIRESAVAKRLAIKIQRNIMVHLLSGNQSNDQTVADISCQNLDGQTLLEDTIHYLLHSLGERDTQVRLASSKALSVIAQKLDQGMADEIVDAVIENMNEDILEGHGPVNYAGANALKWHGLTFTLAHLLFRRIPSPHKLQGTLDALFKSLSFNQRTSSGHPLGGNVRDAANFGLWSVARRYRTAELSADATHALLRTIARNLICAACLDPEGNVRRGSSAALQELVGRHPNTIPEGILLIHVIDYQAVGLRSRAIEHVAVEAGVLANDYRTALQEAIFSWRGLEAPDYHSRESAARALFGLIDLKSVDTKSTIQSLDETPQREAEKYHGLMMALAEIVRFHSSDQVWHRVSTSNRIDGRLANMMSILERVFVKLRSDPSRLQPSSRKPDLVGRGVIALVQTFLIFLNFLLARSSFADPDYGPGTYANVVHKNVGPVLTAALRAIDEQSLDLAEETVREVTEFSTSTGFDISNLARSWLQIKQTGSRSICAPGLQVALGTICRASALSTAASAENTRRLRRVIIGSLIQDAQSSHSIDVRVVAIRALSNVCESTCPDEILDIIGGMHAALNDYTNTERGDIGSLCRIEALKALRKFWDTDLDHGMTLDVERRCYASCLTLVLGKLDRVRVEAVRTLQARHVPSEWNYPRTALADTVTVSGIDHYRLLTTLLRGPSTLRATQDDAFHEYAQQELLAVLEGFAISAGSGTPTTLPAARDALAEILEELPVFSGNEQRSLLVIGNAISSLLSQNLTNDRLCVPLLETIAFLLDYGILQRLYDRTATSSRGFNWRTLLALVQKSHFKSTNLQKLLAAVNIYGSLVEITEIRHLVLAKIISTLSHPFPSVRVEAAKVLHTTTGDRRLKPIVWPRDPKEHKDLVAELKRVSLHEGAQHEDSYAHLNPSRTVPCLIHRLPTAGPSVIGQSVAALEYLEEAFPSPPLLPPLTNLAERAKVRQLVQIIASDTQPLINRRIAAAVSELGKPKVAWARKHTMRGLAAFEKILEKTAGTYCVGDKITMADVVLAPMMWNAEAYDVDFEDVSTVTRVYRTLMTLQAFERAHWREQEGCPDEYRNDSSRLPAY
ncbi:MAG: hypothetical protein Q9162_000326 [Coniocarpon cinnabarinum]